MTPIPPIQNRLNRLRAGNDPHVIARMPSGYAILANQQPEAVTGCCMLLPDLSAFAPAVPEHLTDLDADDRARFLLDVATLGEAVMRATGAERINYLILCNQVPELHAHMVPRFASEDPAKRLLDPFAAYDFAGARKADAGDVAAPDRVLLDRLKAELGELL